MTKRLITRTVLLLAGGIALSGCGDSDSPFEVQTTPAEPQAVDFKAFVTEQFSMTADDTDPRAVDDVEFEFNDQDDPDAFSELLDGS